MIKTYIYGISGKMGKTIMECLPDDFALVGGADSRHTDKCGADVIIDFSSPAATSKVIKLADKMSCPVVIATTGHNQSQIEEIRKCATRHAVLMSGNMSIGIHLIMQMCKDLKGIADCEIVETHHRSKKDAPSGTAIMLKEASGAKAIHSLRLSSVIGQHTITFGLDDEIITVTHTALSRKLFALGAIKAAKWLITMPPSLYNFDDFINSSTHYYNYNSER